VRANILTYLLSHGAQVTLAFLCMLLVLTNVVSVYATLPRLDNQSRVWLSDFCSSPRSLTSRHSLSTLS